MPDTAVALQHILESSSQLTTWSLAVFGGSIALIVSTSYHRPTRLIYRLPFALFLLGWAAIAKSLHAGNLLTGAYLASLIVGGEHIPKIASNINDLYGAQRSHLFIALGIFGVWLVYYLLAWMFSPDFLKDTKT